MLLRKAISDSGGAGNMAAKEVYEALVKYTGGVKTVGLCAGGGCGFVVGGNASTCLIVAQLPSGEFVLNRTESVGVDLPTIGGSVEINLLAAWGVGVNVGIEFGIGAENSKGKQGEESLGGSRRG
ncbi:hypothetical protein [Streptomyces sp. UG1]|uniref:hypothetical protein n=1 Tax=Streptomyces sp. UG1 TaxID=3417652 RepID=UPI003CEEEAA5